MPERLRDFMSGIVGRIGSLPPDTTGPDVLPRPGCENERDELIIRAAARFPGMKAQARAGLVDVLIGWRSAAVDHPGICPSRSEVSLRQVNSFAKDLTVRDIIEAHQTGTKEGMAAAERAYARLGRALKERVLTQELVKARTVAAMKEANEAFSAVITDSDDKLKEIDEAIDSLTDLRGSVVAVDAGVKAR